MNIIRSLKTKLLSAIMAITIIASAFPVAAFALTGDSTSSYAPPTAEQIREALGQDGQLIYYNDFSSASGYSFNTGAKTNGVSKGLEGRDSKASFIASDPLRDGNVLCLAGSSYSAADGLHNKSNVNLYVVDNATPVPENSGKSFVWSADIMLGDNIADGNLIVFMCLDC